MFKQILEGFVRAKKPLPVPPSYPPPALPRGYTPLPAGKRRSRFEPDNTHEERDQALGRHELSAEARGSLLGEKPIERKNTENVANDESEQMPMQTDNPMLKSLGRNVNFISADTLTKSNENPDFIPINKTINDNVRIFKPFVSDPMKQARYEKFLENKDKAILLEKDDKTDRLSEWERNREFVEFEQAEKLYKPLTGVMGERFTHGSQPDEGALNPLCAVAKSCGNRNGATQEQMDAAAKGLYGALTRTRSEWRPESLVCKRFNIPDPFETRPEQKKEEKSKIKYSIFDYLESSVHDKESFTKEQTKFSGSKSLLRDALPEPKVTAYENNITHKDKEKETCIENLDTDKKLNNIITNVNKRMTVAELFLREAERDQAKVLENTEQSTSVTDTIQKFDKMELYNAIFLSDSEEEEEKNENEKSKEASYSDFVETPKNVERNPSPPRGIFANIDFDELNSWNKTVPDKMKDENKNETKLKNDNVETKNDNTKDAVEEENVYGPKIPEKLKVSIETSNILDIDFKPSFRTRTERDIETHSSSDSWVEAKESAVGHTMLDLEIIPERSLGCDAWEFVLGKA
ncbi:G patch domain-containing protein 1 [Eumeta japonica]|uniref:G patch domain-containing protein 1 n=1 Tax=Eumeta variegata TaxID=151549 RepID=A0A4C1T6F4_EUMVA|nr:G patch domain-containing protein 1 [Eumeta japonica]